MAADRKKAKSDDEPADALPAGAVSELDHLQARATELQRYNEELEAAGLGRASIVSGGGPGAAPGTPGSTGGSGVSSANTVGATGGAGTTGGGETTTTTTT